MNNDRLTTSFDRLIAVLERMAPPDPPPVDLSTTDCFIWNPVHLTLDSVENVNRIDIALIQCVDNVRDIMIDNTRRFAEGFPANNILLWGARGMGKSSLVKAVHHAIHGQQCGKKGLKLIEIHREDINSLPVLMNMIKKEDYRFILFCDDLSFDHQDTSYKSLKGALEGGLEGKPDNIIFYATSNHRHLLPRNIIDNEYGTATNPSETVEEKISLSDRFGLWLGFHKCSQADYLTMVKAYADYYQFDYDELQLYTQALEWATTRGNRSGRVAWQFIQDLSGRLSKSI